MIFLSCAEKFVTVEFTSTLINLTYIIIALIKNIAVAVYGLH